MLQVGFDTRGEHVLVGTHSGSPGRISVRSKTWTPLDSKTHDWASQTDGSQPIDFPDMFYFRPKMLAFSPDGTHMAATSGDTTIRIYQLYTAAH